MSITAALVKELRERTGAGMMECKKALVETNGDIEKAIEELRKAGIAKAGKKSSRIAAEGNIFVELSDDNKTAVILEVNCETDFVGSADDFTNFSAQVAKRALETGTVDVAALGQLPFTEGGETIEQTREALVAKIGENIQLRRAELVKAAGTIVSYKHGAKIGVVVALDQDNQDVGRDVAMHIAAMKPVTITADEVSPELVAKEREIETAKAEASGKPADIIQKMIDGRMAKFVNEVSLTGQAFVKDPQQTVGALLKAAGVKVTGFVRYEVGEGIEKEEVDFAKEVMEQVKGTA